MIGSNKGMNSIANIQPGYYPNLQRLPFHNPTRGGLSWSGEGRGCNQLSGWMIIDQISIVNNVLAFIELRFQQNCEGTGPPLRGKIRWSAADETQPPGPLVTPPADLWRPAAGSTPASGNFVYLESLPGDWVGQGQTVLYREQDTSVQLSSFGARLNLNLSAGWSADFQGMNVLSELRPGYYGNLGRYPFHNPVKGGLNWSGQGRGCNTLSGWFMVDAIQFRNGVVSSIDLRFEQRCEGSSAPLRGQVRWSSGSSQTARGAVRPMAPGPALRSNGGAVGSN
jgi:hypothetical protein